MKKPQEKHSVIKSAMKMSMGTLSSRILGVLRDALIGAFFNRMVTDAFLVAFRLPNFFRRLLGEGSLNVSFVPVFVEQLTGNEEEAEVRKLRAMRLANSLFTLLLIVAATISLLGIVFMEELMGLLVGTSQFAGIEGKFELTVLFARIMFGYLFLVSTYAYLTAIANSLRAFFIPALAPALFNVLVLVATLFSKFVNDTSGLWVAWGVMAGGLVQLGAVAIQLFRLGALPRLTLKIRAPGLMLVLKNMLPALVGLGILQVISLVNISFAAQLPQGAHTYLYYGDRLVELPQSLLAISLGTALLPSLSELLAQGRREDMLLMASRYMRLLIYLALPCCVGLFVLAEPIIDVLFGRGEFKAEDVQATAQVLRIYSFLLLASSFTKVTVPSFYAIKDTRTPAIISCSVVLLHVLMAPFLMNLWGLKGLALSTTISAFLNTLFLLGFYGRLVGELYLKKLFLSCFKMLPGLVVLGLAASFLQELSNFILGNLEGFATEGVQALLLFATIGVSALLYFGSSCYLFKVEEARYLLDNIRRRWSRGRV